MRSTPGESDSHSANADDGEVPGEVLGEVPRDVTGAPRSVDEEFTESWPRIVRALASFTGSLDEAEEYAAESLARAAALPRDARYAIESLTAWCISTGRRAWIDARRRAQVEARLAPELATPDAESTKDMDPDDPLADDGLDDRLALLFVACDEALSPASQMVLALRVVCGLTIPQIATHLGVQETAAAARLTRAKKTLADARGAFRVPGRTERDDRLHVVIACVAGMFTVAHRTELDPVDAAADTGRQALSIADALVAAFPDDTEVRGLRAVIRLGLARRPGRVDAAGIGVTLEDSDRSRWDTGLLAAGIADATFAAGGEGRFAIEAAIAGLHSTASTFAETDWARIVHLYEALELIWPSPSVTVARLAATAHGLLAAPSPSPSSAIRGDTAGPGRPVSPRTTEGVSEIAEELRHVEEDLLVLEGSSAAYVSRDAKLTLADLAWRTGRREQATQRYLELADLLTAEPLRRFCLQRAAG